MSNCRPLYEDTDTDGTALAYCKNDVLLTKQVLNSHYGTPINTVHKKYITVSVDNAPMVIFTDKIISVAKMGERAHIACVNDTDYYTDNSYVDVMKMLLR